MDIIHTDFNENIDMKTFKIMIFLYNALENGWSVKKKGESYIFNKKHHNQKEIFNNNYLSIFMEQNSNIKNIISKFCSEIAN